MDIKLNLGQVRTLLLAILNVTYHYYLLFSSVYSFLVENLLLKYRSVHVRYVGDNLKESSGSSAFKCSYKNITQKL